MTGGYEALWPYWTGGSRGGQGWVGGERMGLWEMERINYGDKDGYKEKLYRAQKL